MNLTYPNIVDFACMLAETFIHAEARRGLFKRKGRSTHAKNNFGAFEKPKSV